MPARQAKWVARVLSGRAAPLPDCATLHAEAAAFYALLERAGVPVRYTHRQVRAAFTAACMPGLMRTLHAAAGTGAAASMIRPVGACGMHVSAAQRMRAAGLCSACSGSTQLSRVHGRTLNMLDFALTHAHNVANPSSKDDWNDIYFTARLL